MKKKFALFRKRISLMQTMIHTRMNTQQSKLEMLIAMWDKTLGKVYLLAQELKDKKVVKVIDKIVLIPKKIQIYVLKYYLKKCFSLHAVAFF
jgi:ubiquinone biosynthesis protein Coq4